MQYTIRLFALLFLIGCKSRQAQTVKLNYSKEEAEHILCHCEHVFQTNYIYTNQLNEYSTLEEVYKETHFKTWNFPFSIDSTINICGKTLKGYDQNWHYDTINRSVNITRLQQEPRSTFWDTMAKIPATNEELVPLSCAECDLLMLENKIHFNEYGLDSSFDLYIKHKYQLKGASTYSYYDIDAFCDKAVEKGLGDEPAKLMQALRSNGLNVWNLSPTLYFLQHQVQKKDYFVPKSLSSKTVCSNNLSFNDSDFVIFKNTLLHTDKATKLDTNDLKQLKMYLNAMIGEINYSFNNYNFLKYYIDKFFDIPIMYFNADLLAHNNWFFESEKYQRYLNHLKPDFFSDSTDLTKVFYHLKSMHPSYGLNGIIYKGDKALKSIVLVFDTLEKTNSLYDLISISDFQIDTINNKLFSCNANQIIPYKYKNLEGVLPFLYMGQTLFYYKRSKMKGYLISE